MKYLCLVLLVGLVGCEAIEVETEYIGDDGVTMDTVIACCECSCYEPDESFFNVPITVDDMIKGNQCWDICQQECKGQDYFYSLSIVRFGEYKDL